MTAAPWTPERVLALAPDAASARSGRDLAAPRKWLELGTDGRALWGVCQGSGKDPYRTVLEPLEPAFRCSCPSRKFPCKHALGLFLIHAEQPAALGPAEPPAWAREWLEGRARRAGARAAPPEPAPAEPATPRDPKAQARRAAAREARVEAGILELRVWLHDLVRGGLAAAQARPAAFWEGAAARLVDAQAPGLARLVRELGAAALSGDGWTERLLAGLGRLHLVLEGYGRLEALPEPTRHDLRAAVGFTTDARDVAAAPGVQDRWLVLGSRTEHDERLRARRTWLFGLGSGRAALLLDFAAGRAPLPPAPPAGLALDAELAFYPGTTGRALPRAVRGQAGRPDGPIGHPDLRAALAAHAALVALTPWLERDVLVLAAVTPVASGAGLSVRDASGRALPLAPRLPGAWPLLALSGGRPVGLAGEWDGEHLRPLGAWAEDGWLDLSDAPGAA